MLKVHLLIDEAYQESVDAARLTAAAQAAWRAHGAEGEAACTLRITDDETLRALNARYRGVDAPTDVLSFADGTPDPETGTLYLGDIAIAFPRAAAQATQGGHPVMWELCLLVVHGVLHLLGHDHATQEEKARMWALQREALTALQCPLDPA